MSSTDMPSKHDILAEHLYTKVEELEPKYPTSKLTGMLLDGGEEKVVKMLQEPLYLQHSVDAAVKILDIKHTVNNSDPGGDGIHLLASSDPELCDTLYDKVHELEHQLCPHITGMLVELDITAVKGLLASKELLQDAVLRAKDSYMNSTESSTAAKLHTVECNNNTDIDTTDVGDILYDKVHQVVPQQAAEITGMLLEMEESALKRLISQPKDLQICIQKAYSALQEYTE